MRKSIQTNAHALVGKALASGRLRREPCSVCGTTERVLAHHEDYSKPLDVVWHCPTHHGQRHAEIGGSLAEGVDIRITLPAQFHRELRKSAIDADKTLIQHVNSILTEYITHEKETKGERHA